MMSILADLKFGHESIFLIFASRYTLMNVCSFSSGPLGGGVVRCWHPHVPEQGWLDL